MNVRVFFLVVLIGGIMMSCSTTKYVPEGSHLLSGVSIRSAEKGSYGDMSLFLRQTPNSKWFSLWSVPLHTYNLSGRDSTKWINRALRRMGDAPVLYDSIDAVMSGFEMRKALQSQGYWHADVKQETKKRGKKVSLQYTLIPNQPIIVDSILHIVPHEGIKAILDRPQRQSTTLLWKGMPLDVGLLDQERTRITTLLRNRGYYDFDRRNITFTADTFAQYGRAQLIMKIDPFTVSLDSVEREMAPYRIGEIYVDPYFDLLTGASALDTTEMSIVRVRDVSIYEKENERPYLRSKVILDNLGLRPDSLYRERGLSNTYSRFSTLGILSYTNMRVVQRPDTNLLDCYLYLSKGKTRGMSLSLEGTNSAGDLGMAASLATEQRNLLRGSETFSLKLRGAYEAISGLTNAITNQYTEYGVEASLRFPRLFFGSLLPEPRRPLRATTELSVGYSSQRRPEFARNIFDGRWTYRWSNPRALTQHRVDLIDVSYIKMPWISKEYEENYQNSILKYNYNDQMIMRVGYGLFFSNNGFDQFGMVGQAVSGYTMRLNVESAGNMQYGIAKLAGSRKRGADQRYLSFGIPFEQYVKMEVDLAAKLRIDYRNLVALRAAVGVAVPYENSEMMPFQKRYFSGGANSVRGWSVRGLGPGRYPGGEASDFMNRSGDVKLDLSAELRTKLFWKLHGAFFIDAGNIWTIRAYEEQPDGQFAFNTFYRELAAAYGLGLRFDFDFFILRLDGAMKAVNPAKDAERYAILRPRFGRDFTFHFSIGYPF